MLEAGPSPGAPGRAHLEALLAEVTRARDRLTASRREIRPAEQVHHRRALLDALEDYAAALAACGAPMPYRLRDELELYRVLGQRG